MFHLFVSRDLLRSQTVILIFVMKACGTAPVYGITLFSLCIHLQSMVLASLVMVGSSSGISLSYSNSLLLSRLHCCGTLTTLSLFLDVKDCSTIDIVSVSVQVIACVSIEFINIYINTYI